MRSGRVAVTAAVLVSLIAAAPASADLASLKAACAERDAADGRVDNGRALPFLLCDDGVAAGGGRTVNNGAVRAVAVPQRYAGFAGLPAKVTPADPGAGADANGDIALDVDVSLPDPARNPPPPGGYPLIVMMHGCCGGNRRSWEASTIEAPGEQWHYSNAWFASRGYVVLNYTARGFVNGNGQGSTGETQIDDRRFEINDFQHLAGQLADDPFFRIDPEKVVATGGSYGGGFSWLALTDPTWRSPGGKAMRLASVAPKYGWTDLVYSLVPTGAHLRDELPPTDGSLSTTPLGFPKKTTVAALYATGTAPNTDHATFPRSIDEAFACLQSTDPFESNPLCAITLQTTLPAFIAHRSAYYQNDFFERLRTDPQARVPVFSAGTLTDPLFTPVEHRRMVERLKSVVPGYPVQEYYGDYLHFVQSKAKEWADLCGQDHHPCRLEDYPNGELNARPGSLARRGVNSRLDAFVDHYARPPANPAQAAPDFDVTASLQICPDNATAEFPANEPGEMFTAPTFGRLALGALTVTAGGTQVTTNDADPNPHAASSDPLQNQVANGGRCAVERSPGGAPTAGPGVATYDSQPLGGQATMIGQPRVFVPHSGAGGGVQLNARLYDLFPDGRQVMVDRGVRRVADPARPTTFDLHGNGWRFPAGHRIRIELAQDDDPFVKASNQPSSLTIPGVLLSIPVREAGSSLTAAPPGGGGDGRPGPRVRLRAPRVASERSRRAVFGVAASPARGVSASSIGRYLIEVRDLRRGDYRTIGSGDGSARVRFRGRPGGNYRFRARGLDRDGNLGPAAFATTVVPVDDFFRRGGPVYSGGWTRRRAAGAYGGRVSTSTRRRARLRFAFRGGSRVYLVGRRSPSGGRALVIADGRRHLVSFYSRRVQSRRLIVSLPTSRRSARNRLEVVNLGRRGARRSTGTTVQVDAIGVLGRKR